MLAGILGINILYRNFVEIVINYFSQEKIIASIVVENVREQNRLEQVNLLVNLWQPEEQGMDIFNRLQLVKSKDYLGWVQNLIFGRVV